MADIEATGGLVSGGLIAGAIEAPTGRSGELHGAFCSDCGRSVSGNFCAHCGQPTHVHRSLLHLGEELLHGVMHFDARIWRTLPLLLLNPGRLTREWVEGRRTRYVSPLAIFLFTVFLMFFALSFAGGEPVVQQSLDARIAGAEIGLRDTQAALTAAEAEYADATPPPGLLPGLRGGVAAAEARLETLRAAQVAGPRADGLTPGSWQADLADAVHDDRVTFGLGDKKMQAKILHKLANPDLALYKVQQTLYKFAFLLVPLSIPFVWLLFLWKRGFTWYDHGVFVLYSLTFMAILAMVLAGLGRLGGVGAIAASALVFAVPAHIFFQLKGAYGLSIFSALWRACLLMIFCTLVFSLFLVAVILLGLGA